MCGTYFEFNSWHFIEIFYRDFRDTCELVRSSSKNVLKLNNYEHANNEKDNTVIIDCETRWNSTFDMLNCALKLKSNLQIFPKPKHK